MSCPVVRGFAPGTCHRSGLAIASSAWHQWSFRCRMSPMCVLSTVNLCPLLIGLASGVQAYDHRGKAGVNGTHGFPCQSVLTDRLGRGVMTEIKLSLTWKEAEEHRQAKEGPDCEKGYRLARLMKIKDRSVGMAGKRRGA
ncbi:hypothetical protein HaLaN_22642, partial [Haematococcus lacustris]